MLRFLQSIGKSLMLPVAVLPAAAILLRFGKIDYASDFHLGSVGIWLNTYIAPFLDAGGSAIFDNLPLIFAISIGIGIGGDAVAVLSALIAYLVMEFVFREVTVVFSDWPALEGELNMGVMGGIIAGLLASYFYKRFHQIKLPDWLGFFSGKRFVPIITSVAMVFIAIGLGLIWGSIQATFNSLGQHMTDLGGISAFVYSTLNRLLIPFGLHHVLNNIVWFQVGTYVDVTGHSYQGDIDRFFGGDPQAGLYMTGFFPIMMFALPAAALAIVHTAKKENKKYISSIFISAALASFLTGITEPLEFAFMFTAPLLYAAHAVLTGISAFVVAELGMRLGFGFSAGFIDYVLNYPLAEKPLLLIPVGLIFAVVYYTLFRFMIVKFNIMTPGRETLVVPKDNIMDKLTSQSNTIQRKKAISIEHATSVAAALGQVANIQSIDACITRLRVVVHDEHIVDDSQLKALGAAGVIRLGKGSIQVVFGMEAEKLKDLIKSIL
ncbi:MAG TPA: PTS transporter subunit EIIC [Candidatus Paenibacillus intestinavium]|nr:PTS transporter subunit EIIC [Candidatus Paenibacillus intestinavium]